MQCNMTKERPSRARLVFIFLLIVIILLTGSIFYYYVENWRFIDALYFSTFTLTTIGYGDITPQTDAGKIFTIFYILLGVGVVLYGLYIFASFFVGIREHFWIERLSTIKIRSHTSTFWQKLKYLNVNKKPSQSNHKRSNTEK